MAADGKEEAADTGAAELPSYSDARNETSAPAVTTAAAPAYSSSSSGGSKTEHVFSLNNSKGKPWLSLVVTSRAPSVKALPVFLDGDAITGEVRVALDKAESAKAVSIGVSARLPFFPCALRLYIYWSSGH